jgi:hypothetical protein
MLLPGTVADVLRLRAANEHGFVAPFWYLMTLGAVILVVATCAFPALWLSRVRLPVRSPTGPETDVGG